MRRAGYVLLAVVAAATAVAAVAAVLMASSQPAAAPRKNPARSSGLASSVGQPTVTATATAVPVAPDPRVGAIFLGGQSLHTCTGSVLNSSTGDLILTAAHCLAEGADTSFVPGFANSAAPQDFWHVDAVYLDPRWVATKDPLVDFAVARVSRQDGGSVEASVGGGLTIAASPGVGTDVVVTGYALGAGGVPVGCRAVMAALERGYPSVRCAGLVDGTSGSPWLSGATVVGVTGGLEGGGCQENVSYAPPFDRGVTDLLARAEAGGPADVAPAAFAPDC